MIGGCEAVQTTFLCLAVSSFSSRTKRNWEILFLRISSWLLFEKEARQGEEDDKMLFSFVLSKSHPFKFLLVKVIKESIFLPTGMPIDIRNDVLLMIVSFAFIEISRAILHVSPQTPQQWLGRFEWNLFLRLVCCKLWIPVSQTTGNGNIFCGFHIAANPSSHSD